MYYLPYGIDYTKYNSDSGMSTRHFGPNLWDFLFTSILGRYPIIIDSSNTEHHIISKSFYNMINNLQYILPCVYCRNSFSQFLIEFPLTSYYLKGRFELFYWLYLMKDKINKKLIDQENILIEYKTRKYKNCYDNDREKCYRKIKNIEVKYRKTIPTPSFEQVLDKYEKYRAVCHDKTKTCTIIDQNNY